MASSPAKDNSAFGEEKRFTSPYSVRIIAAEIALTPLIERVGGFSLEIALVIIFSVYSIFSVNCNVWLLIL